jgi:hypothetical protein
MLRYLVVSAVLVVSALVLGTGWAQRDLIRIRIAAAFATVPPKPEASGSVGPAGRAGVRGDAPWALSALPECLIQTSETTGPLGYVLRHLPTGSTALGAPARLVYGDCTISLVDDEAYVVRGNDRLRIPPRVRFYRSPGFLALLRTDGSGNELRVYATQR